MTARGWILTGGWALAGGLVVVLAVFTFLGAPDGPHAEPSPPERNESGAGVEPSIWRQRSDPGEGERRADPSTSQKEGDGEFSGTAALADGRPLEGITVVALVNDQPTSTATTDAEGRFVLRGLAVGRPIRIRASGLSADGVHVLPSIGSYPRGKTRDLEVTVKQGAVIEGRVFGPDGQGLANVEVFLGSARGNFRPSGEPVRTDEHGRFRHVVRPKTTWGLRARMDSDETGMPFALGWTESVKAPAQDVRIDLKPGEEIRGEVVSPEGLPVAGLPLKATLRTLPLFRSLARTDQWGRFVIRGFSPGFYRIWLDDARHQGQSQVLQGGENVRSGGPDLKLSLRTAGTISGRLLLASGQPAIRQTFLLKNETEGWSKTVRSGRDGEFVSETLPRGTYVATVWRRSVEGVGRQVELCRMATGDSDVVVRLPR